MKDMTNRTFVIGLLTLYRIFHVDLVVVHLKGNLVSFFYLLPYPMKMIIFPL